MPRMLAANRILRLAAEVGAIPASMELTARDTGRWRRGELDVICRLTKQEGHLLTFSTHIGDARFGDAMAEFGRLAVSVQGLTDHVIEWPTRSSAELESFVRESLGQSAEFIVDREDLCEVLASYDDVARGRFYAWLPRASYPGRLVGALIIARDMGSSRHVAMIEEKLNGSPVILSNGDRIEILPEARYWAKEFEKVLGAKIDL